MHKLRQQFQNISSLQIFRAIQWPVTLKISINNISILKGTDTAPFKRINLPTYVSIQVLCIPVTIQVVSLFLAKDNSQTYVLDLVPPLKLFNYSETFLLQLSFISLKITFPSFLVHFHQHINYMLESPIKKKKNHSMIPQAPSPCNTQTSTSITGGKICIHSLSSHPLFSFSSQTAPVWPLSQPGLLSRPSMSST